MKVYTKSGDTGTTSLIGGRRVTKDHPRVEAYGNVDELSAHIGVVRASLFVEESGFTGEMHATPEGARQTGDTARRKIDAQLHEIQVNLITLSSHLANDDSHPKGVHSPISLPPIPQDAVTQLENAIDSMQAQVPPLLSFVIPGPPIAAAFAHVARTVCRRAERSVVALGGEAPPEIVVYLNRLSDFLFVLSRYLVEVLE